MTGSIVATITGRGTLCLYSRVDGEEFSISRKFPNSDVARKSLGEGIEQFQVKLEEKFPDATHCWVPELVHIPGTLQFRIGLPGTTIEELTAEGEWRTDMSYEEQVLPEPDNADGEGVGLPQTHLPDDKSYCCQFGCQVPAEFEIIGFPNNDMTQSCRNHIGILLGTPTDSNTDNKVWNITEL